MNKDDVFQYLKENYDQLTESQKIIGKYVLDNYRDVAFMSAIELGNKVGVSDSTIIRFTRTIGFNGFSEFKNNIRQSIKNYDPPYKRLSKNISNFNEENNLIMQIGKSDLNNLEDFLLNIETKKIEEAVEAIYEARTIFLMGTRSSGLIIDFFAFHLRRMGFTVIQITKNGLANVEKLTSINQNDLLIASSFPRYSKPTYKGVMLAKKKGAKVLTITDNNLKSISIKSDIVFSLNIENSTFFNSYIVPMELINILIMSVLEKDKKRIYKNLKDHIEALEIFDMNL
jgi:DNA-binding MurR/RpiR family transcriptional regulator